MKIIVGLGNPESKYNNTFHNLGFMCVDESAKKNNAEFNKEKFSAIIAETKIGGEKVIFAKPTTYMNLSGVCVGQLVEFYKIPLSDLLILYDDFDLKKGEVRIRKSGSAGTHNGMRNIIEVLGSGDFPRIRVGFKPEEVSKIPLIDLVLSGIKEDDKLLFNSAINKVACAVCDFIKGDNLDVIISRYNGLN